MIVAINTLNREHAGTKVDLFARRVIKNRDSLPANIENIESVKPFGGGLVAREGVVPCTYCTYLVKLYLLAPPYIVMFIMQNAAQCKRQAP